MSFPRYPKYKDSGVEWLGDVPEHWEVRRLRQIGPLLKGCGGSKEDVVETGVPCVRYGDLYTTHAYFIRQARTCVTEERSADYFPIQKGDVLFAASGEDLAEIGRSAVTLIDERVCCGGDLVILRPEKSVVPEFMGFACDCWVSKAQKASMGRGTTVKHIYPDELKRLLLALPPIPEQAAIAAFLDRETAKIDALIAEQQRLIELLQEKRQAVISHAVTKGLNPDAPMKDSGIEWLGEVPEHWELRQIKHFFKTCSGGTPNTAQRALYYAEPGYGYPWVRTTDLTNDLVTSVPVHLTEQALHDTACEVLPVGTVMIAMYGGEGTVGKNGLLMFPAAINQAVCGLLPNSTHDPRYTFRFMQFYRPHWMIGAESSRKDPNISQEQVKKAPCPCPSLDEQRQIASFLEEIVEAFRSLITEAEHAITLLQERRSAVISAAVTGQIDVRGFSTGGGSEAA